MTSPSNALPAAAQRPLLQRLGRFWPYFRQYRIGWVLAVVASLIGGLTQPAIPALLKPLLDNGFTQHNLPIWMVPVGIIGLFAIRGVAQFASRYALSRIAADGMVVLRKQLFDHLMVADLSLFGEQSASQLANTIVYEVQTGTTMLVDAFLDLARDSFTVVALLIYLLWLNWQLTLIVLVLVPCVAWVLRLVSKRLYRITRDSQQATDQLAYVVEENVLSHRMVRLHGAADQQAARFYKLNRHLRDLALKATRAAAITTPLVQMVAAIALSVVIVIAMTQSRAGGAGDADALTVGSFVAVIGALLLLLPPTRHLAGIVQPVTRGLAALERGLELMESIPSENDSHALPADELPLRARGDITLDKVTVTYGSESDDTPPALHELSLHLDAGETVALVGPSGAGKTTVINLLPRFITPSAGRVLLDGTAVEQWPMAKLRAQFALVSQEVTMFDDSIAANIALGAETIDRERVAHCLEQANLAEHVANLPQGMDTQVGHNATELSGGQRQRLAIARALYKDAPVLLLDEATSALDTQSERLVQQALATVMSGRTTVVIAHRLSTIEHADRIVVMERGQIIEQGTHTELLARGGLYARLHGQMPEVLMQEDQ